MELYWIKVGYAGVDLFFLLSAYSLADKPLVWSSFFKGRFITLYSKFLIFVAAAALLKHWTLWKALRVALFLDFFLSGGGSFLWFIPAILLFYAFYPLFLNWKFKHKAELVLLLWLIVSYLCQKLTGYSKIFIFTNRIPVILAGWALKHYRLPRWFPPLCLPFGLIGLYLWGFTAKLNAPFTEFYFLFAGLAAIGLAALTGNIKTGKIVRFLAGGTLELYALQMIIGSKLVSVLYHSTGSKLLTNLLMLLIMVPASALLAFCYRRLANRCHQKKKA